MGKKWKQPKCPWMDGWMDGWLNGWMDGWMDGWINSLGSTHTVEYDSAMKRSEALAQATTWMDFEHMMLSERSRHRRTHSVHRDRKWVRGARGWGRGMGSDSS